MLKSKKIIATRKKYNAIKKYDRQEMEDFLNSIYTYGYKIGRIEVIEYIAEKFNSDDFRNALKTIKGFGKIRVDKIINAINEIINSISKEGSELNE